MTRTISVTPTTRTHAAHTPHHARPALAHTTVVPAHCVLYNHNHKTRTLTQHHISLVAAIHLGLRDREGIRVRDGDREAVLAWEGTARDLVGVRVAARDRVRDLVPAADGDGVPSACGAHVNSRSGAQPLSATIAAFTPAASDAPL